MEHNLDRAKLRERTAEVTFLRSLERELRAERDKLLSQNADLDRELRQAQDALAAQIAANQALQKHMQASVAGLSQQLDALKQSLSWRITAPLRAVLDVVLGFIRK